MHSGAFLKKVTKIEDKKEAKHVWWKYRRKHNPIHIGNEKFQADRFSNLNLSYIPFNKCVFEKCRFFACDIRNAIFEEVVFDGCTFTNIDFNRTIFRGVYITNSNFINCVMDDAIRTDASKLVFDNKCGWNATKEIRIPKEKNIRSVSKQKLRSIRLYQKRSITIYEKGVCNVCGTEASILHEYRKTSVGKIRVCRSCQIALQNRSFGSTDAMNHSVQGGGFSPR